MASILDMDDGMARAIKDRLDDIEREKEKRVKGDAFVPACSMCQDNGWTIAGCCPVCENPADKPDPREYRGSFYAADDVVTIRRRMQEIADEAKRGLDGDDAYVEF